MYTKTISVFNGNGNRYTLDIPTLYIFAPLFNKVARKHFEKNTGLKLIGSMNGYIAKPRTFKQLYKVFVTYNFKSTYYNNGSFKNTLMLKFNPSEEK